MRCCSKLRSHVPTYVDSDAAATAVVLSVADLQLGVVKALVTETLFDETLPQLLNDLRFVQRCCFNGHRLKRRMNCVIFG